MTRYAILVSLLFMSLSAVGCTTQTEQPDATQVKEVDPAEIQKQIQEGMKQSGGTRQSNYKPAAPK